MLCRLNSKSHGLERREIDFCSLVFSWELLLSVVIFPLGPTLRPHLAAASLDHYWLLGWRENKMCQHTLWCLKSLPGRNITALRMKFCPGEAPGWPWGQRQEGLNLCLRPEGESRYF